MAAHLSIGYYRYHNTHSPMSKHKPVQIPYATDLYFYLPCCCVSIFKPFSRTTLCSGTIHLPTLNLQQQTLHGGIQWFPILFREIYCAVGFHSSPNKATAHSAASGVVELLISQNRLGQIRVKMTTSSRVDLQEQGREPLE